MDEKKKKYLIYGGVGVGVIGGGIFLYLKYFNNQNAPATNSPTVAANTTNATNGMGAVYSMLNPSLFPASNEPANTTNSTPEFPVATVTSSNTPLGNTSPVQTAPSAQSPSLNNFISTLVNNSNITPTTTTYTIPTPATPNLNEPQVQTIQQYAPNQYNLKPFEQNVYTGFGL